MRVEATIALKTDIEELTACQQAVGMLMCDGLEIEGEGRDKVATLLGFLGNVQSQLYEQWVTQQAAKP